MDRRSFIKTSALSLAAGAACGISFDASAEDEIVVGGITDLSGGLDIYGNPWPTA